MQIQCSHAFATAFCMSQHRRLGNKSVVPNLTCDILILLFYRMCWGCGKCLTPFKEMFIGPTWPFHNVYKFTNLDLMWAFWFNTEVFETLAQQDKLDSCCQFPEMSYNTKYTGSFPIKLCELIEYTKTNADYPDLQNTKISLPRDLPLYMKYIIEAMEVEWKLKHWENWYRELNMAMHLAEVKEYIDDKKSFAACYQKLTFLFLPNQARKMKEFLRLYVGASFEDAADKHLIDREGGGEAAGGGAGGGA